MKNIFLSLFFISLFFINPVNSNQKISFIDMDKVISTTNSGSSILKQLSNINNKNSIFLNKEQKKLICYHMFLYLNHGLLMLLQPDQKLLLLKHLA